MTRPTLPLSLISLATICFSLLPQPAIAALYKDVPDGHPFLEAIESLTTRQVFNGYSDSTFKPDKVVNRAEMLKILYKAAGKTVDLSRRLCFSDVEAGSWYEAYVCSAEASGFVRGYGDGKFRPGQDVTRVEALKMIMDIFGLPALSQEEKVEAVRRYTDIPEGEWYAAPVAIALHRKALPIFGQDGDTFAPATPLKRSEVAAYVHGILLSLGTDPLPIYSSLSSESSAASSASSRSSSRNESSSSRRSSSSSRSSIAPVIKNVSVPFTDSPSIEKKLPVLYRFTLSTAATIDFDVQSTVDGGIQSCTLYRLGESGISNEYYFGFVQSRSCKMRTALSPGSYQLEIRGGASATLAVSAKAGKSDGNDGIREAVLLKKGGTPVLSPINDTDFWNWYKFTVTTEQKMTLMMTSTAKLQCFINPGDDVDLFSFSGPTCNAEYSFSPGTYYVGVGHTLSGMTKETYLIQLK